MENKYIKNYKFLYYKYKTKYNLLKNKKYGGTGTIGTVPIVFPKPTLRASPSPKTTIVQPSTITNVYASPQDAVSPNINNVYDLPQKMPSLYESELTRPNYSRKK
jgi:hypothetical protein